MNFVHAAIYAGNPFVSKLVSQSCKLFHCTFLPLKSLAEKLRFSPLCDDTSQCRSSRNMSAACLLKLKCELEICRCESSFHGMCRSHYKEKNILEAPVWHTLISHPFSLVSMISSNVDWLLCFRRKVELYRAKENVATIFICKHLEDECVSSLSDSCFPFPPTFSSLEFWRRPKVNDQLTLQL